MDVFVGYPSSVSDRRIFVNSDLYRNVTTNVAEYFDENQFILGDKAYPNLKWILSPYIDRGHLQERHKNFNKCHASTRSVVERSFALLFGRFRRLKYLDMCRMDLIPKTVLAACVLHNICLMFADQQEQYYVQEGREFLDQRQARDNVNLEQYNEGVMVADGNARREIIAQNLPRH
ncbi:hypothetical protein NQ315_016034 [Exocentrus adspersus]|uniref:DDE Tnp4 domain-containing protein n=2 Tax=Exocentrus adspersus TaxID=1586481 RepID=A0AAV8V9H4_9CUCU|nr:hypothetical protein NQ315_016034 [Exocentrus adspersus]